MNNKTRLPRYIWFSLPALMLLWGDTARRIKFVREPFWDKYDIWQKACLHMFKLSILYLISPIVIYFILVSRILRHAPLIAPEIIVLISLAVIYFSGVYVTYRHYMWRKANISHLLNKHSPPRRGLSGLISRIGSALKNGGSSSNRRR